MALAGFHPLVSEWFSQTLGVPTSAQERGWKAIREGRHTLIAAPTGSGKTLAAFLTAIDDLVQESGQGPLRDEIRVIYVSPLKALSADIHKNLAEPRRGIRQLAEARGVEPPRITAAVRTGDTTQAERAAILRRPPHILVTTPESLYLLVTARRSRELLRTVRTVIVDEIHAVIGTRRGAHLALTLERLEALRSEPAKAGPYDEMAGPYDEMAGPYDEMAGPYDEMAGPYDEMAGPYDEMAGPHDHSEIGPDHDHRQTDHDHRQADSVPRVVGAGFSRLRQRIGLSATQKPIEEVARFLVGNDPARGECAIVDEGHRRELDLAMEIPRSPLSAVMAHEVWEEYYDRLAELIAAHNTTLIFVNTRRMAERAARHLSERLGEAEVTAHHGSLSKDTRLDAEHRLKTGALKALVATASLELGIDIGHVDLVCQIGSPHRIATLLQRVGRSGHTISGTPKGRLMPVSRDDLLECAALLRSVRHGELDCIRTHDAPLDVLAQQVTAEVACREYAEDDLFALSRRAWPYRDLKRSDFDAVTTMLAEGFATRRGRRAALVHRDEVHSNVRARRGSRMLALTCGGAIPEVADYRVLLEPDETFVGTLNEDFAIESLAGDIFQLGNASWQITRVTAGTVRVTDAHGAPPTIPFWLGEAPARSDELSRAVSDLRGEVERLLQKRDTETPQATETPRHRDNVSTPSDVGAGFSRLVTDWLMSDIGLSQGAADQLFEYLAAGRSALGVIPTQDTLVLERFFDESGGMQLVLHAPFGSRINRAWALALRKRFCRQFNFELQGAATEDAILLSLGPQHSFPLADVFRYVHPATLRDTLVQAILDAPLFATRWRWNATVSLAVPRSRNGAKVAPPLQRMQADDLMAAAFPDAAACLDNIPGDREIPDHPLVNQSLRDCLEEAMDVNGLAAVLSRVHAGQLRLISRDTPEPSAFADDVVNARPYQYIDDAPLEERRTHAVQSRRPADPGRDGYGSLDADAIARVVEQERPDPRDADELHDDLLGAGFLRDGEVDPALLTLLADASRATCARRAGSAALREPQGVPSSPRDEGGRAGLKIWVAAERLPELLAVHPDATLEPSIAAPPSRAARTWTRENAITELLRGRLAMAGPVTAAALAESLVIPPSDADAALLGLESEGVVLRGVFTPGAKTLEWCDRVLLARIHRYTLNRLRAEIAPVTPAEFMRFLFNWQHVHPSARLTGPEGLRAVLAQLDAVELPARAWERDVLPARVDAYEPAWLDMLCLTGEVGWARLSTGPTQVVGATPIALFLREHADTWLSLRCSDVGAGFSRLSANQILEYLKSHGASFSHDLATACAITHDEVHAALADLVAAGYVSSDGPAGLRRIIGTLPWMAGARRAGSDGRWFALREPEASLPPEGRSHVRPSHARTTAVETLAWTLLHRYGVVFRRLLTREAPGVPWRELVNGYRRLEARGEIRGGRFVSGPPGEQYALPDAVDRLREIRRSGDDDGLITISAADPLNLTGIVTAGDRIRFVSGNRVVYRNGVPIAAMEGDVLRQLCDLDADTAAAAAAAAAGRQVPVVTGYVGKRVSN
jgi:ATP-dependent Lhr-like helicase